MLESRLEACEPTSHYHIDLNQEMLFYHSLHLGLTDD
ncbi:Uncharacterised protein [Serratia liquefaciens]|nr:Uncharacterised protein [Serratia liquefaciens]